MLWSALCIYNNMAGRFHLRFRSIKAPPGQVGQLHLSHGKREEKRSTLGMAGMDDFLARGGDRGGGGEGSKLSRPLCTHCQL